MRRLGECLQRRGGGATGTQGLAGAAGIGAPRLSLVLASAAAPPRRRTWLCGTSASEPGSGSIAQRAHRAGTAAVRECYLDSPWFREKIRAHEAELERTNKKNLIPATKSLSAA
ncbi:hypothetical protein P7K49_000551 [Saguinus oedipus]|uniref:Uncharacterized protein n=1 Tax=Saguinus oedipus TaxID=9490 RepID=A0ABQ9WBY2_SAGOE|nr:hypothetical protein P7K49_000551 [Saguinus oedipus]